MWWGWAPQPALPSTPRMTLATGFCSLGLSFPNRVPCASPGVEGGEWAVALGKLGTLSGEERRKFQTRRQESQLMRLQGEAPHPSYLLPLHPVAVLFSSGRTQIFNCALTVCEAVSRSPEVTM